MEFFFTPSATDWLRLAPELIVGGAALLVLLVDLMLPEKRRAWLSAVALLGVLGAAAATAYLLATSNYGSAFFFMVTSDPTAILAYAEILFTAGVAILLSPSYLRHQGIGHQGEYYALVLLATAGMMLLAAATNLMTIFVGLELLSLALYILAAYVATRLTSQEAGMKYFLLSSFASGFLLYGMALTYGATGATGLSGIRNYLIGHPFLAASGYGPFLVAGLALMAVGFCFKVSTVPFHTWTPDVYVGAPTTITAFMSVGTKVAAFVALARVFLLALYPQHQYWQPIFWAVAILSMIVGNFLAVTQTDVKRILAYSSVAHAGYIMVGIATGTALGFAAVLVYLATYAVMNLGAFGVVLVLERRNGTGTSLADYAGLARRQPLLAAALLICLLSLAGVPPSAGFVGKWDVFYAAVVGGHLELAIVGVAASVLGMFYYLRVIWAMYFVEPARAPVPSPLAAGAGAPEVGRPATALGAAPPALATAAAAAGYGAPGGAEAAPVGSSTRSGVAIAGTRVASSDVPSESVAESSVPAEHHLHNPPVGSTIESGVALAIATGLTVLLGIVPGPLYTFATQVATVFVR